MTFSTSELTARLSALNEKKCKADRLSISLASRTDLSEKEREQIDYECMLTYMAASIRMQMILQRWDGIAH